MIGRISARSPGRWAAGECTTAYAASEATVLHLTAIDEAGCLISKMRARCSKNDAESALRAIC